MEKLIKEINESIENEKQNKTKATYGLISSTIIGVSSIVGGVISGNAFAARYGVSAIVNVISGALNYCAIGYSDENIKQLKEILEKAVNKQKEIQEMIDKLIKMTSDLEKGLSPKMDLKINYEEKYSNQKDDK